MDRQKESQVEPGQTREELRSAKARLAEQAGKFSIKECMARHPYLSLGASFFAGAVLGGSKEIRECVAHVVAEVISNEVLHRDKKPS